MPMTESQLWRLLVYLKRPIPDPPPEWLKLTPDQTKKFEEIQARFNSKIAELEAEKMKEIGAVLGVH